MDEFRSDNNEKYSFTVIITESCTSTSQSAFELVAEVADWRRVVRRNTYCCFLYSSQVRNFSCSAWNNLTTSPWVSQREITKQSNIKQTQIKTSIHTCRRLTPFKTSSLYSLNFMKSVTFQLVLQFRAFTCIKHTSQLSLLHILELF